MDLRKYVGIVTKNWWVFALCLLLGGGIATLMYVRTPPTYASDIQFYVSTPLPDGSNAQSAGQFAQNRVNSYIRLLTSEELAKRVIEQSKVPATPRQVAGSITATADVNTVLINVRVSSQSADRAQQIAQGVAATFGKMVDGLDNQGRQSKLVVINIVSGPTRVAGPVAPQLRLFLVLGAGAGLLFAVVIAIVRELMDTSIRDIREARAIAKAPVLGTIPYDTALRASPLIGTMSTSSQAEAFRKVRTNLQFVGAATQADVILVTSAVPQEGKSVSASNLGLSLAELNKRVLVIDADLRRPRQAEYFDIANGAGLSNVLAGQVPVEDVIQPWGDVKLSVLPSGEIPPNPAELLGSAAMSELIERLRPEFDHIIIDSPPILPVTDATVLAGQVDGVVLVVRLSKTSRQTLSETIVVLETAEALPIGVIANSSMNTKGSSDQRVGYYTEPTESPAWRPKGRRRGGR